MTKSWETYEEVARYLIEQVRDEFGLKAVESKQDVPGEISTTAYELDAKGVMADGSGFIIIECKRHTTARVHQGIMGALAWNIIDTGAAGGILVSPLGLQDGAERIAAAVNIFEVKLNADATPEEFRMEFLNKIRLGFTDTVNVSISEHLVINVIQDGKVIEVREVGQALGVEALSERSEQHSEAIPTPPRPGTS